MKRFLVGMVLCTVVMTGCSKKEDKPLPLTDEQITEAVAYGTSGKDLTYTEITKDWTVDLGYDYGKGRATIITPFLRVVLLAQRAAVMGEQTDRTIIEKVMRDEGAALHFRLQLYGDDTTFGNRLQFALRVGDMMLKPCWLVKPTYTELARDYTNIAVTEVKFKRDEPISGKVTLTVMYARDDEATLKAKKEEAAREHEHAGESKAVASTPPVPPPPPINELPKDVVMNFDFDLSQYK